MKSAHAIDFLTATAGGMTAGGSRVGSCSLESSLPPVDMSEQGYALSLAYSGDASWQSIRILREQIILTLWRRHVAPRAEHEQRAVA